MDVSVIIVNYNTAQITKNTIASLFEKTEGLEYEVIVVDNASSDNSKQLLAESFGNRINYLQLNNNIGFGRANNVGLEIAKGRNVFLLNPDILLINNAVKILSDFVDSTPNCGVCGGNLYDENKMPAYSFGRMLYSPWFELNRVLLYIPLLIRFGKNIVFNHSKKVLKVAHIVGADMMFNGKILKQLGGFDSDFFMYCEETELCYRVKKLGFHCYSVPAAEIIHLEGKSFTVSENREIRYLEGRETYYKKTSTLNGYMLANKFNLIALNMRLFIFMLQKKKKEMKKYQEKKAIFKRFIRGRK